MAEEVEVSAPSSTEEELPAPVTTEEELPAPVTTEEELPTEEKFGIISDDEEDEEEIVQSESGFGNIIVVDNLPVVESAKYEKLRVVVQKIFSQIGSIREGGLFLPRDEEGKTKGYAFVEFSTPAEAAAAMEQTNGYKLDKHHYFNVTMFDGFEKAARTPDIYAPPPLKEYTPAENLQQWLLDERGRDQFVIRFGSDTEVYWNDARIGKPDPCYQRGNWTESFVQWSPSGSFLATVHRQGAVTWGGPSWQRLTRYAHPLVRLLEFSPGEKFLVTYSTHEPAGPKEKQMVSLNVFDVRSGKLQREFKGPAEDFITGGAGGGGGVQWPIFRWAGGREDKYFARIGKNAISVYETETMGLLDKKSIKIDHVQDFCWSPSEPLLAMFIPEANGGNQPARVSLMSIPSREEVRQKNLFSVSDCRMYWQSGGEYLAVKVERHTKTKKSTYSGFELFRIKERDIPMEVLELENKNEKILEFAWEPKGHRFAIVHGDGPKPDVSFYTMYSEKSTGVQKVSKLVTLKGKNCNALFWSPMGKHIVMAGLKSMNGQLEFYNVDEGETTATGEHFMATDVDWDPSGRYVATTAAALQQMESGVQMWSFSGKLLYRLPRDRFTQFLWRPRPASLLSPEQEGEVAKSLRKYSKKYEEEDAEAQAGAGAAEIERRRSLSQSWKNHEEAWRRAAGQEEEVRTMLIGEEEEVEELAEEVEVEEIIDIQEEIMSFDT